jgi:hypothetical protein
VHQDQLPAPFSRRHRSVGLCEALDRVLDTGAVIVGEVVISVADVDLIFLGFQLVLTSVEAGRRQSMGHLLQGMTVTVSEPEARP